MAQRGTKYDRWGFIISPSPPAIPTMSAGSQESSSDVSPAFQSPTVQDFQTSQHLEKNASSAWSGYLAAASSSSTIGDVDSPLFHHSLPALRSVPALSLVTRYGLPCRQRRKAWSSWLGADDGAGDAYRTLCAEKLNPDYFSPDAFPAPSNASAAAAAAAGAIPPPQSSASSTERELDGVLLHTIDVDLLRTMILHPLFGGALRDVASAASSSSSSSSSSAGAGRSGAPPAPVSDCLASSAAPPRSPTRASDVAALFGSPMSEPSGPFSAADDAAAAMASKPNREDAKPLFSPPPCEGANRNDENLQPPTTQRVQSAPAHEIRESPGYKVLRRVLIGLAVSVPEVGYLQGMNFLTVFALLNFLAGEFRTDEDASDDGYSQPLPPPAFEAVPSSIEVSVYHFIRTLITGPLSNFFTPHLPGLLATTSELSLFLDRHDPELASHLRDVAFLDLTMLTPQWFVCLFVASFKIDATSRLWDLLLFVSCWGGANARPDAAGQSCTSRRRTSSSSSSSLASSSGVATAVCGSMSVPLLFTSLSLLHACRSALLGTSSLPRCINFLRSYAARCENVSTDLWDVVGGSSALEKFLIDYPSTSHSLSTSSARPSVPATPSGGGASRFLLREPDTAHKRKAATALLHLGDGAAVPWWRGGGGGGGGDGAGGKTMGGGATPGKARVSASTHDAGAGTPGLKRRRSETDCLSPNSAADGGAASPPGFLGNVGNFFRNIMTPNTAGGSKRPRGQDASDTFIEGDGVGCRALFADRAREIQNPPPVSSSALPAPQQAAPAAAVVVGGGKAVRFGAAVQATTSRAATPRRQSSGRAAEDEQAHEESGGEEAYQRLPDSDAEEEEEGSSSSSSSSAAATHRNALLSPNSMGFEMTPIRRGAPRRATPFLAAASSLGSNANNAAGGGGSLLFGSPFGKSGGERGGGCRAGRTPGELGREGGKRARDEEGENDEAEAVPLKAAVGLGEWRSPNAGGSKMNGVLSPLAKMR